ncbi:MAG: sortase [Anaerolineae bacterium]|nr:sortase [Anaerolineae bacterium]
MKQKLIAAGIVSPIFMAMCVAGVLFAGLAGWSFLRPAAPPPNIRKIATVGPLLLPEATPVPEDRLDPTEEVINQPVSDLSPAQPEMANSLAQVAEAPAATAEIEKALGFALPPNTVNSVTQQGVASRFVVPKLKLDAPVVLAPIKNQTWDVNQLGQAVGHLEGTAPPGSNSNIVLAGHVTLAAGVYGPFAGLAQLAPGDRLIVYQGDHPFEYVVDNYQIVERTAIEVTYPSDTGQITLITCNNWNSDENRYDQRIVVRGHLVTE